MFYSFLQYLPKFRRPKWMDCIQNVCNVAFVLSSQWAYCHRFIVLDAPTTTYSREKTLNGKKWTQFAEICLIFFRTLLTSSLVDAVCFMKWGSTINQMLLGHKEANIYRYFACSNIRFPFWKVGIWFKPKLALSHELCDNLLVIMFFVLFVILITIFHVISCNIVSLWIDGHQNEIS